MNEIVNINDAIARFAQLLDRAENGEEMIIERDGYPIARLVPFRSGASRRKPGRMRGEIRIGRDFESPLPQGLF
jgi:prevent-host-death family protein